MEIFFALLFKLIPLYVIIFLGFVAGKFLHVKKESVASLVIYLVAPIVFFHGVYTTHISLSTISSPLLVFAICCCVGMLSYGLGSLFWKDSTRNILAFIAADGNSGYFGLPVALILFPESYIGLFIFAGLGVLLYESTLGFFIAARGAFTVKDSFIKLIKLPVIYSIALGLIANLLQIHFGSWYPDVVTNFKGAYTILGMMIIGLGIAAITEYKFDFLFTLLSFIGRFLIWPILAFAVIFVDSHLTKFYSLEMYRILTLLAVVPLAANSVAFATLLKSHPEKVALTVLLSTLFALLYIPFIAYYFLR